MGQVWFGTFFSDTAPIPSKTEWVCVGGIRCGVPASCYLPTPPPQYTDPTRQEAKPVHADRRRRHSVRAQDVREEAKPNQRPPLLKREVAWSQTLLEGTPPFQVPFQPFQSATEMAVGINGACGSAAGSVSTKPAPRPSPSPLPSALRDASRARPMRTLRFSEIVEQRDISPNPRSVSGSDGSGCDRPRAGQADPQPPLPPKAARRVPKISQLPTPQSGPAGSAASSKTSADSKPAPVQSSSFAEFLFFQPSPEAPSPHLSSFLFAADSAASESNLDTAAEPMKHAAQANQNALRSARHHHQSEIQHKHHSHHSHSTAADDRPAAGKQGKHGKHHQQGRTTRTGSTGTVPSSCHGSTPPVGDCGGVERVCSPPVHVLWLDLVDEVSPPLSPLPSPLSPLPSPLSPLPSPLSPLPPLPSPPSPLSPLPSPLSPLVPCPLSPVPSPLSPVPCPLSPVLLSPAPPPTPLPLPLRPSQCMAIGSSRNSRCR